MKKPRLNGQPLGIVRKRRAERTVRHEEITQFLDERKIPVPKAKNAASSDMGYPIGQALVSI